MHLNLIREGISPGENLTDLTEIALSALCEERQLPTITAWRHQCRPAMSSARSSGLIIDGGMGGPQSIGLFVGAPDAGIQIWSSSISSMSE